MLNHSMLRLKGGVFTRLWAAKFIIAFSRRLVVSLIHLILHNDIILFLAMLFVRRHYHVIQINVIVHVIERCLSLVSWLIELG